MALCRCSLSCISYNTLKCNLRTVFATVHHTKSLLLYVVQETYNFLMTFVHNLYTASVVVQARSQIFFCAKNIIIENVINTNSP